MLARSVTPPPSGVRVSPLTSDFRRMPCSRIFCRRKSDVILALEANVRNRDPGEFVSFRIASPFRKGNANRTRVFAKSCANLRYSLPPSALYACARR